jgi:hypothetical protein
MIIWAITPTINPALTVPMSPNIDRLRETPCYWLLAASGLAVNVCDLKGIVSRCIQCHSSVGSMASPERAGYSRQSS